MSFFIDKFNRRKSPIALAAFAAALLDMAVFGVLYGLLAEPLYHAVSFSDPALTLAVHSAIISIAGTAVCCLLFLLKDKRVVPYGFSGLLVALCMFYIAALLLSESARPLILYLITIYGLGPVLVGNAVTWPIYLRMKRDNPALNHKKTIAEELRYAVAQEQAKHPATPETAESTPERAVSQPGTAEQPQISAEEALFGPQADHGAPAFHSAQEEAMLFYEDEDDEEAGDH